MSRIFVGAGSNLGNRFAFLSEARASLAARPEFRFMKASAHFQTKPEGGPEGQDYYLNAVWEFETGLQPREVLGILLETEKAAGRERTVPNAPRTLDLDLLSYDDLVLEEPDLVLPHPRMQDRVFVLKPLSDVASGWIHPVLKKSATKLLEASLEGCPQP